MTGFLDTNIFIYALSEHPEFGAVSRGILRRVEAGEEVFTSTLVLCEVAWVLEARGTQGDIKTVLEKILSYRCLRVVEAVADDLLVGAAYMTQYGLDYNDAVNLAIAERLNIEKIYTNDKRHLGRVEHIEAVFE
ncbi:PIN domain-containing protein [Candidatus Bathyarchaeota archaeon]|nr:PIN domain-containing protein [Candidatus Bathyarchaeota archaeon]